MNLDDRARQASSGLKAAVATSPISSPIPGMARLAWVPRLLAAIGTAAAVVMVAIFTIQVAPNTPAVVTQPPDGTVIPEFVIPPVDDSSPPKDPVASSTTTLRSDGPVTQPDANDPGNSGGEVAVDSQPPSLAITYPVDGDVFETDVVRFEGVTEPGAVVTAGRYEADVAPDGTWSIVLVLSPGSNRALFTAVDEVGNESTARVTVDYKRPVVETTSTTKPKEEPTTTTIADVVEFSANQVYRTCPSSPPFDVFWGTAQPGSKVIVSSEFGMGSVKANADGGWELRVEFPDAPAGVWFAVKVKSEATGATKVFEFSYQP